jgi:hypothetical protein
MNLNCGQPWWSTADFTIWPGSFSQVELRRLATPDPLLAKRRIRPLWHR